MTQIEKQLWERIEDFKLDDSNATLTFSERLARQNGWGMEYTRRVIEEYKKFIFLCCISPTPVTPSDPVDQAWHLHLTYTKSYWNDLCGDTLKREIHHNPTKGGSTERYKFDSCYTTTLELYKEKFGQEPPEDIWHDNKTRFNDINFRRVNTGKYWTLQKPSVKLFTKWFLIVLFTAVMFFIEVPFLIIAILITMFVLAITLYNNQSRSSGNGGDAGAWYADSDASGCSSDTGDSGCSGCGGCGGD